MGTTRASRDGLVAMAKPGWNWGQREVLLVILILD